MQKGAKTPGFSGALSALAGLGMCLATAAAAAAPDYAVIVSRDTQAVPAWREVVEALRQKHQAAVIVCETNVEESLPQLKSLLPRYVAFVARAGEASEPFVARVQKLTRSLDEDSYPDCFWGIVTGVDAAAALQIARWNEPLTIRKGLAGTYLSLDKFEAGQWYSELEAGRMMEKAKGGEARSRTVPTDTTEALVKAFNDFKPDLFLTSGHATERDWQIGYTYRNGYFRCKDGKVYGQDTQGRTFPIDSPNPKVYMPVGNCLMGHIDGTNSMALAFMNNGGVRQMLGYTVPTWYGYAGWGCLDYFVEQPGRYTFTEAVFANQAALAYRLQTCFPALVGTNFIGMRASRGSIEVSPAAREAGLGAQDALGLLHDRDVLAFYGDPAWEARLAPGPCGWEQSLTNTNGTWSFEIRPKNGAQSFAVADKNGSQRGRRPIVQFFPKRLKNPRILSGENLHPVLTENFILVPVPGEAEAGAVLRATFKADN